MRPSRSATSRSRAAACSTYTSRLAFRPSITCSTISACLRSVLHRILQWSCEVQDPSSPFPATARPLSLHSAWHLSNAARNACLRSDSVRAITFRGARGLSAALSFNSLTTVAVSIARSPSRSNASSTQTQRRLLKLVSANLPHNLSGTRIIGPDRSIPRELGAGIRNRSTVAPPPSRRRAWRKATLDSSSSYRMSTEYSELGTAGDAPNNNM